MLTFPRIYTLPKSPLEKWRVSLTIVVAPLWSAVLVMTAPKGYASIPYEFMELSGLALIFTGVLGRIWCAMYIGGRKDRVLCTTGPYSLCRNPLYFFSLAGVLGICLASQNVMLALITAFVFGLFYHFVILKEEVRLSIMFGVAYDVYVCRVPRFFPRWQKPVGQAKLEVNMATFKRSILDVGWFLIAILAVEIINDLRGRGILVGLRLPY